MSDEPVGCVDAAVHGRGHLPTQKSKEKELDSPLRTTRGLTAKAAPTKRAASWKAFMMKQCMR
jgi:hypothetical protein